MEQKLINNQHSRNGKRCIYEKNNISKMKEIFIAQNEFAVNTYF